MVRGRILDEIWLLAILEPEGDVFKKAGLVSFDGEMIMGMTFRDQIVGELALGQQGIGRYILALEIDGYRAEGWPS